MKIFFDQMEEKVFQSFKGGEGEFHVKMYTDPRAKIMRGRLLPGYSIGLHTHEGNSEMIYILSGTGKVLCDGEYEPLAAGDCHYCSMGHAHSLINDSQGDLCFFAVVPEHGVTNSTSFVSP